MNKSCIKNNLLVKSIQKFYTCVVFFSFFLLLIASVKAEVVSSIPRCIEDRCLNNITDLSVSSDGSFFLIVDSSKKPYVRKFNFSSNMINHEVLIPLRGENLDLNVLKIGISKDKNKALVSAISSESSTLLQQVNQGTSCKCSSGNYFDEASCVVGTLTCPSTQDAVCGCDNQNYLNSCIARANGIKKYTKANCGFQSNLACISDDQCPLSSCNDGRKYKQFTCTASSSSSGAMCILITFSSDPCSSSSSSGATSSSSSGSFPIIQIIDLTNNSVSAVNPFSSDSSGVRTLYFAKKGITAASFNDNEGKKLIVSDDDEKSPQFVIASTSTEKIEKEISIPDNAKSIEFAPDFKEAVITFSEAFAESIGIFINRTRKLIKFDIPAKISSKVDEILSRIKFDLGSTKAVASSFGGRHVLHILDLLNNKLIIRFLGTEVEGKTISTLSQDGKIAVSVANVVDESGIIVYKLDTFDLKLARILKSVEFNDVSNVLGVDITPDNNNVLVLAQKDSQRKIKVLNLIDLSLVCEYSIGEGSENSSLISDPYGRYLIVPDFQDSTITSITELQPGPILKSIAPIKGPLSGGTEFTIDGFIDPSIFTKNIKVCFRSNKFCSSSVSISDDGKTITGITPKFVSMTFADLILIAEPKTNVSFNSSSGGIQCNKQIVSKSVYSKAFKFE
ncbi:MAG: hypothetical protein HYY52_03950 [Candidatus Melainabacteria bacterium]|nr:hypothetical protein [Candidatus Melainabacteria bacterium]